MGKSKTGRNDTCWCGSGVKFKKCHLNRAEQKPVEYWEAASAIREKFSRRVCSAPKNMHNDCAKKIIRAHTVPKSSSLKAIAIDGHVLGFKPSLENFQKSKGVLQPEKIGINNASAFTGFCQKHDDQLFSCLEKEEFNKTEEQCFKLAFRSFSREHYTKSALADMFEVNSMLDKGKPVHRQLEIQEQAFLTNIGAEAALKDNEYHKEKFDSCINNNDFSDIRAFIIEFSESFPVQVSGSVNPDFNFDDMRIQDLSDLEVVPDLLSFTSFFDGSKGYMVLSWLPHCHKTCVNLIKSLLTKPENDISTYLLQFIFSNFENLFISPKWWERVSEKDKDTLIELSHDNVSVFIEPHGKSISDKLISVALPQPSKFEFVGWNVLKN